MLHWVGLPSFCDQRKGSQTGLLPSLYKAVVRYCFYYNGVYEAIYFYFKAVINILKTTY